MDYLIHTVVLLGILALILFGPRRGGHRAGPTERTLGVLLFTLIVLAFAMSYLWHFLFGGKLPLTVG